MLLVALEPPIRKIPSRVERLRKIPDKRNLPWLVQLLPFVIPVIAELERVVAVHGPVVSDPIPRLKHQRVIHAMRDVAVPVDDVREGARIDAVEHNVGKPACNGLEVFDHIDRPAMYVRSLRVAPTCQEVRAVGCRELAHDRRLQVRIYEHIRCRHDCRAQWSNGIVSEVETWREVYALSRRALIHI